MNSTRNYLNLEFITVKPYLTLKNLGLLLAVMVMLSLTSENSALIASMCTMYGVMYASYPFALGEKNSVDYLYPTLAVSRRRVVQGRYIFSALMLAGFALIGLALAGVSKVITGSDFGWGVLAAVTGVLLLLGIAIMSFQLPIYFKLGYSKARVLVYLPLVALPAIIMAFVSLRGGNEALTQALTGLLSIGVLPFCAIAVTAVLVIYCLSCRLSVSYYQKRDL